MRAILVLIVLVLASAAPAHAAVWIVDAFDDAVDAAPGDAVCAAASGACTLRAAVMEANASPGADTVFLPAGSFALAIAADPILGDDDAAAVGDLDLHGELTLEGNSAAAARVEGLPCHRVLDVQAGARVRLSRITVTGGGATWPSEFGQGIRNAGTLSASELALVGNGTTCGFPTKGGAIANLAGAELELTRSFIGGNAGDDGGGIANWGELLVTNSTFTANTAYLGGAIFDAGTAAVRGSTLVGNAAGEGGGGFAGALAVANSIVAGNESYGFADEADCRGGASDGHNLVGVACPTLLAAGSDQIGTVALPLSPGLAPLAGAGAERGFAPLAGSPALDAGNPAPPGSAPNACGFHDQRVRVRAADGNGDGQARCDIGAIELGAKARCGFGAELAPALAALQWRRRRRAGRSELARARLVAVGGLEPPTRGL